MSLINQALRKAQRDRGGVSMRSSAEERRTASGRAGRPSGTNALLISGLVAVALLAGLTAGLTVVLLRDTEPSADVPAPQAQLERVPGPAAPPAAPEPVPDPVEPQHVPPPATEAATTPPRPAEAAPPEVGATAPETGRTALIEELRAAREAAEAKATAEAEAARLAENAARQAEAQAEAARQEAEARAAVEPDPEVIEWLGRSRITGIRLSADDSKVILNGKAYGIGETVHYALGVQVLAIREKRVYFVDAKGVKYMKRL